MKCGQGGQFKLADAEAPAKQVSQNRTTQRLAEMQTWILQGRPAFLSTLLGGKMMFPLPSATLAEDPSLLSIKDQREKSKQQLNNPHTPSLPGRAPGRLRNPRNGPAHLASPLQSRRKEVDRERRPGRAWDYLACTELCIRYRKVWL